MKILNLLLFFLFATQAYSNVYDYACRIVKEGEKKGFYKCEIQSVFVKETCDLNFEEKEDGLICYYQKNKGICKKSEDTKPLIIFQAGIREDLDLHKITQSAFIYPQISIQLQKGKVAAGGFLNINGLNPSTGICFSFFEGHIVPRAEVGFDLRSAMDFKYAGFNIRFNCWNLGHNFYLSPEIFTNYYREACLYSGNNDGSMKSNDSFSYTMGVGLFLTFGGNYDVYLTKKDKSLD